jgi:hypothetical protein
MGMFWCAVHTRNSARGAAVTPPSTSDSGTAVDEAQPQAAASDLTRPEADEPHMNGELKSHIHQGFALGTGPCWSKVGVILLTPRRLMLQQE